MASTAWPDSGARLQAVLTGVLAVLAAAGFQFAAGDAGLAAGDLVAPLFVVAGAVVARVGLARAGGHSGRLKVGALTLVGFLSVFVPGSPLSGLSPEAGIEYQILAGLRNAALVAAVFADQAGAMRTAVLCATPTILFSFALGKGWGSFAAAAGFAGTVPAWLVATYWRSFAERLPAGAPRAAPWSGMGLAGLVGVAGFLAAVVLYPSDAGGWLQEIVGAEDLAAQREEVERWRANRSNFQALGNLADERYGAAANADAATKAASAEDDLVAGLQQATFPLARKQPATTTPTDDRVLFQYKGHGPRHVPMTTYDRFDGSTWRGEHLGPSVTHSAAEVTADAAWLETIEPLGFRLDRDDTEGRAGDAVDQARRSARNLFLRLQGGGRLVEPRVRGLNRARLLRSLAADATDVGDPERLLTPYDFERLGSDPVLSGLTLGELPPEARDALVRRYLADREADPEKALPADLRALLDTWVKGEPRGWPQIEAVVRGLRGHARHDPGAVVPPGETDPVRYFLMKSRQGPDYLFASSAAILLRHLGYPTRLVGGFNAGPNDYRRLLGTTPVRPGDVHYWTQVMAANGTWVNLEPTPDYEAPQTPPGGASGSTGAWTQARDFFQRYRIELVAGLAAVGTVFVFRRRLAERLATAWWYLWSGRPAESLVPSTWRLIDRRARLAGVPRGRGQTLQGWSGRFDQAAPNVAARLAPLGELADRVTHAPRPAPGSPDRWDLPIIRAACRAAVRDCTVRALARPGLRRAQHEDATHGHCHR